MDGQPASAEAGPPAAPRPLLPGPGERWLPGALLIGMLLVFGQRLFVPYWSFDDYVLARQKALLVDQYLTQERPLQLLYQLFGNALGAPMAQVPGPWNAVALVLLALATTWLLRLWDLDRAQDRAGRWLAVLCGLLALCAPYFAELWSFRIAPLYYALALAPGAAALVMARERRYQGGLLLLPAALVAAGLLTYQLALPALACAICGAALLAVLRAPEAPGAALRPFAPPLAALVAGYGLASLIGGGVRRLWGLAPDPRGALVPLASVPARAVETVRLLKQLIVHHPAFATPAQRWLLVPLVAAAGLGALWPGVRAKRPLACVLAVLLLKAAWLSALLAAVPLQSWSTTPRVLVAMGLFWALALAAAWSLAPVRPALLALGTVCLLGFSLVTVRLGNELLALNAFDRALMNRVIARLEALPGFEAAQTLVVTGAPDEPAGITRHGDQGRSAFSTSWSPAPLFGEVLGRETRQPEPSEVAAASARCAAAPRWPAPGSALLEGRAAVLCFTDRRRE